MENKNLTLKEKEINKDYYLKRAIIFSLITAIGTPYVRFIGGSAAGYFFVIPIKDDEMDKAAFVWWVGNFISLVIWLIFVGLTIYYNVKSWKAYKACQEENNQ